MENKAVKEININSKAIEGNIDLVTQNNRGLIAQNILSYSRNFVEAVAVLYYEKDMNIDVEYNYDVIKNKALKHIKEVHNYRYIAKLHQLLQITESHYTQEQDESLILFAKYIEYLIRIKRLLECDGVFVLNNIEKFPLYFDPKLNEYYQAIFGLFDKYKEYIPPSSIKPQRCYIYKKRSVIINGQIMYEITLVPAIDNVSKFDRMIAFTQNDFPTNYPISIDIIQDTIRVDEIDLPIHLILFWSCSIRPCELRNMAKILGFQYNFKSSDLEYKNLMKILMNYDASFIDFIDCDERKFNNAFFDASGKLLCPKYYEILKECRLIINSNKVGSNVLRYLLYTMNNIVIKDQYDSQNANLSNMFLTNKCLPFDNTPYSASLAKHNVKKEDLFECISYSNRADELLANKIISNTENHKMLYTPIISLGNEEKINELISRYNSKIYYKHTERRIEKYKDYVYLNEYETNTLKIINSLLELSKSFVANYSKDVNFALDFFGIEINDLCKKQIITELFSSSKVAYVYGSAGTGKTTLLKNVSDVFFNERLCFVANTNPAVENLRKRMSCESGTFLTVQKAINNEISCDILLVDECSTISNKDMVKLLERVKFDRLILTGDTYQIDSIRYGNWFEIIKYFTPKASIFELENSFRTSNKNLLDFWKSVREASEDCLDKLVSYGYSHQIDSDIFARSINGDEIILCLSYDGLYGVNNINRILQNKNIERGFMVGLNTFKIGDPILFTDTNRFQSIIYNNMKGTIKEFEEYDDYVNVQIEIDGKYTIQEINSCFGLKYIENTNDSTTIEFAVQKNENTDEDGESWLILPFQLAYAVTIHKAQGLEYDNVKIIIANDSEERITHDIFYTAVTRAKTNLRIYWSIETATKIFENFEKNVVIKDAQIFAEKYNLKIRKK